MLKKLWKQLVAATRLYFVAGLLAFAPIAITFWAIMWIVQRLDQLLLPRVLQAISPELAGQIHPPPLVGAAFTFFVILLAGVIVRHFFGQEVVRLWERALFQVPVARTIYGGVKQLFEAIIHSTSSTYNRVVLIEYPRKGILALAFTTGAVRGAVAQALPGKSLVNCFVPTTPNPTSGFYLLVPEDELMDVELTVEDAFKVIMSAGLVTPPAGPPIQPINAGAAPIGEGGGENESEASGEQTAEADGPSGR